jgi:hypothetical protein
VITLDFETYYDSKSGYSLRNMTTEEYVFHPDFRILMVGIKRGDGETDVGDAGAAGCGICHDGKNSSGAAV